MDETELFDFGLPPPLNYYVYPNDVFILRGTYTKPKDMTCDSFKQQCDKLCANIRKIENRLAVYDVPLNNDVYNEAYDTEEDDEDDFEKSDNDEEEIDDDDDWDVEEDEQPPT